MNRALLRVLCVAAAILVVLPASGNPGIAPSRELAG